MSGLDDFLRKYRHDREQFLQTGLLWEDLLEIKDRHESQTKGFREAGMAMAGTLLECGAVHSVRCRIKDPEHLMEKIVRKTFSDPNFGCTVTNYREKIRDLIGVRAVHLLREEWPAVHEFIQKTWRFLQEPTAKVRKGEVGEWTDRYRRNGCKVEEHKFGYRGVHYKVLVTVEGRAQSAEIQVRTLFDEGWSEIDHRVRYPYDRDNPVLLPYLNILNRLTEMADQTGSYAVVLKEALDTYEDCMEQERKRRDDLLERIGRSGIDPQEKEDLTAVMSRMEFHTLKDIAHFVWENLTADNPRRTAAEALLSRPSSDSDPRSG